MQVLNLLLTAILKTFFFVFSTLETFRLILLLTVRLKRIFPSFFFHHSLLFLVLMLFLVLSLFHIASNTKALARTQASGLSRIESLIVDSVIREGSK